MPQQGTFEINLHSTEAGKKQQGKSSYPIILLKQLVKTDFKLRYQGSALGVAWSVVRPLMLFVVMYMVFVRFMQLTDGTPTYPIVLLLGISLWNFVQESTMVGMQSIVSHGDLLRKLHFPKYIIPLSTVCGALISLLINVAIVVVALVAYIAAGQAQLSWNLLWLPVNMIELIAVVFGITMFLSALFVQFRDISPIWEVVLQVLFYASPIIYPLTTMPVFINHPIIPKIILMNPLAQTIQDIRHNLISTTVPQVWNISGDGQWYIGLVPVALGIAIFGFGLWFFRRNSRRFAEEI